MKRVTEWLQPLINGINLYSVAEYAIILATIALSMSSWSDFVETIRFVSSCHTNLINMATRFGGSVTALLGMLTMVKCMLENIGNANVPKLTMAVVLSKIYCRPLQNSGRNTTMNNFFTSDSTTDSCEYNNVTNDKFRWSF